VSVFFARIVVGLFLVPSLALSATVAPEHAHEADADHPHTVVHRHLQPHAVASHDQDHAQLADDDEHIVWLDNAAVHQPVYKLLVPAFLPAEWSEYVAALAVWFTPPDYDTAPPHGPPRACLSLRAPPSLSA
jgi:hypothetical protein